MTGSQRYDRSEWIRNIFDDVVGLEPEARASRLEDGCGDDAELRREVESLLAVHDGGDTDLEQALKALRPGDGSGAEPTEQRLRDALQDRYRIDGEIGRGGMATVYKARDLKHDRDVAVKVFEPELRSSLGPDRFLREIALTASLYHPHIVPLLDSGEADGMLYYVMPYVVGESLRERLRREKQLPVDDTVRIARQVADALTYASGLGIVHRDIKPENIVLSAGHARVADFGIARALTEAGRTSTTRTGFAIGTPAYMSPEQASGARNVDARSDIYSLGCVVYEMLVGEPPHTGATPEVILARKSSEEVPSIRHVRTTVPTGVEETIRKALNKVPGDRYSTAREFAAALESGQRDRGRGPPRVKRTRSSANAALGALTVALVAWFAVDRLGTASAPIDSIAVLPCDNRTGDPDQEYFVDGMRNAVSDHLARIAAIRRVTSRSSVMGFRNSDTPAREIGQALGVGALVECSVLLAGPEVRVIVDLIDAEADRRLWGESYQRAVEDVLALQGEIARDVAREIAVVLTPQEQARLASAAQVDREAHNRVLFGNYQLLELTDDAFRRALDSYQEAIDLDSTYAPAYAGLALAHVALGEWHGAGTPTDDFPKAREAAQRALDLDPALAEAYIALAQIRRSFEWNWSGAEQAFKDGIAANPAAFEASREYANFLTAMGRFDESIALAKLDIETNPRWPIARNELGFALMVARRGQDALEVFQESLALDPDFLQTHILLAFLYQMRGESDKALEHGAELEKSIYDLGPRQLAWLGYIYGAAGRSIRAREILARLLEMRADSYVPAGAIAEVYLALGEHDQALDWLEEAYDEKDVYMPWLKELWWYDPLRGDARFKALIELMNFPD